MDLGGQKYKLRLWIILRETTVEIICLSGGIFCYSYNRKCYGNKTLQKVNRIRNEGSGIL